MNWESIEIALNTPRHDQVLPPIARFFHPRFHVRGKKVRFLPFSISAPPPHPWMNRKQYETCAILSCWETIKSDIFHFYYQNDQPSTKEQPVPYPALLSNRERRGTKGWMWRDDSLCIGGFIPGNVDQDETHKTFGPHLDYLRAIRIEEILLRILPNPSHAIGPRRFFAELKSHENLVVKEASENVLRIASETVQQHLLNYCISLLLADPLSIEHFSRLMDALVQTIPLSARMGPSLTDGGTEIIVLTLTE